MQPHAQCLTVTPTILPPSIPLITYQSQRPSQSLANNPVLACRKVNWPLAGETPRITAFQEHVNAGVNPLFSKSYNDVEDLNEEISAVAHLVWNAPSTEAWEEEEGVWYNDRLLAYLAKEKKAAWDDWKAGVCPLHGDLYDKKCATRKAFSKDSASALPVCREETSRTLTRNSKRIILRGLSYQEKIICKDQH